MEQNQDIIKEVAPQQQTEICQGVGIAGAFTAKNKTALCFYPELRPPQ
jgi:hypothetical protein